MHLSLIHISPVCRFAGLPEKDASIIVYENCMAHNINMHNFEGFVEGKKGYPILLPPGKGEKSRLHRSRLF